MKYAVIFIISLTSCSTTTQDLENQKSTIRASYDYVDNYQEIYRRVSSNAKRCAAGPIAFSLAASAAVDSELYSELGYGEVSLSLINVGIRNYYWKTKVERIGSGTKMTIYSGNTVYNKGWLNKVKAWAEGGTAC